MERRPLPTILPRTLKHCLSRSTGVCGGQTSRLEVCEVLLDILHLRERIKVTPVNSDFYKDVYFAQRPANERLVNRKLEIRELNLMQDWKIALKEYISQYYKGYLD